MNEQSILAKFFFYTVRNDSQAVAEFGNRLFSEAIPTGKDTTKPCFLFVTRNNEDIKGAFGERLLTKGTYQIRAVISGENYSPLEAGANHIDRLFDWQNQYDAQAGRIKCQEVFTDPDNPANQIMIISMLRNSPIKFASYVDAQNYCNQGGEYEIEYYLTSDFQETVAPTQYPSVAQQIQTEIDEIKAMLESVVTDVTSLKNATPVNQVDSQTITGAATTSGSPLPVPAANKNIENYNRTLTSAALADYVYSANQAGRSILQGFINAESSTFNWTVNSQAGETFETTDGGAGLTSFTLLPGESRTFENISTTVWRQI